MLTLLALGLVAIAPGAQASGGGAIDLFVTRSRSDLPMSAYVNGQLGLVLPGYRAAWLYPAWRALASADAGVPLTPIDEGALRMACCARADFLGTPEATIDHWLEVRQSVVPQPPRWTPTQFKTYGSGGWQEFLNCPGDAFRFAAETLQALTARRDATPERLVAWVEAQDQVFEHCSFNPDSGRPVGPGERQPIPVSPSPLANSEPTHWRQARQYQVAATAFYAGRWAEARDAFGRIASDNDHPWQAWAALARMRTQVREASLGGGVPPARPAHPPSGSPTGSPAGSPAASSAGAAADLQAELQADLDRQARAIAARPDWTAQQRGAQGLTDLTLARWQPAQRLLALDATLARLDRSPPLQALADWSALLQPGEDGQTRRPAGPAAVHDWVRTLQACEATSPEASPRVDDDRQPRVVAFRAALARHRQSPRSSLWLLPALTCADGATLARDPDTWRALQAVEKIPPTHPGWFSLRFQQLRLLREAGRLDEARALLPALRDARPPAASARHLLAQQALAMVRSPQEALPWLTREHAAWGDPDTGTEGRTRDAQPTLALDGARLITHRYSMAQWQQLVESDALPVPLRVHLAIGLWWRAELLGQTARARAVAAQLPVLHAPLRPLVADYLAATTAEDRRRALWRASLKHDGLSASLRSGLGAQPLPEGAWREQKPDDATASAWCRLDVNDDFGGGGGSSGHDDPGVATSAESEVDLIESSPPLTRQFATAPELARERAALRAVGTATGAFARWVLAEAKRPAARRPPDLDWLLYVGVQSTRGGCVDRDNSAQSKAMFQALHRLYPGSPWAAKTRYWY